MKKLDNLVRPTTPQSIAEGLNFRRGQVITARSVGTINVSKGDQCSCTGQPGQCE